MREVEGACRTRRVGESQVCVTMCACFFSVICYAPWRPVFGVPFPASRFRRLPDRCDSEACCYRWTGCWLTKKVYMIAFKDFRSTTSGSPLSDGIDRALVLANEWLAKTGVRPVNIETLTETRGVVSIFQVERGLRVWYEVGSVPPAA